MNYKHLLFLFSIVFLLNSCEKNTDCCAGPPEPEKDFATGTFILNEGNYGSANASVSYINEDTGTTQAGIFSSTNEYDLGDTAQSIEFDENLAFVIVNVSNKIEVVNRYDFQSLGSISSNLQNPRYAEVAAGKLYVTNWGDGTNPDDDFVAVFNVSDLSFIESIPVAEGPEKLIAAGDNIYVAHKGGYSFNNIVSVIDAVTNMLTTEIEVGDQPESMVVNGNDLWVLASGKPSYADAETSGSLTRIALSSNEPVETYDFPEVTMHPENLELVNSTAYYTIGKSFYSFSPGDVLPVTADFAFEEAAMLYGFEIHDGRIYIASPNADFTGDGNLYIYNLEDGSLLDSYSVGINPNSIYFN